MDYRQHPKHGLLHDKLAEFQGPSLISFNDAVFTRKDWEGIQSLQQSVKADDPFKIGQFGIGFNSVYHVTGKSALLPKFNMYESIIFNTVRSQSLMGTMQRSMAFFTQ